MRGISSQLPKMNHAQDVVGTVLV